MAVIHFGLGLAMTCSDFIRMNHDFSKLSTYKLNSKKGLT